MRNLLFCILALSSIVSYSQMNNERLEELLIANTDSIQGNSGRWQAILQEIPMIIVTDQTNDRMRIIAPIIESSQLDEGLLLDCLTANFHSALDVKYAISDGLLWSAFVHPLSPLSDMEVESAIKQVYAAAATFGTTFSSTPLIFGGNQAAQPVPVKKDSIIFKKT